MKQLYSELLRLMRTKPTGLKLHVAEVFPHLAYFRFWSLICGIEAPGNMPRCINNYHNMERFWKNWHASYNKWPVRYMYIPLGGITEKAPQHMGIFTFVAIWHDLEWKLISWAWLTCLFFIPEMVVKSAANAVQIANLVGYVIKPSVISQLCSPFLMKEGLPVLVGMLMTFYIGTKLIVPHR